MSNLPIIDLAPLQAGEAGLRQVAQRIDEVYSVFGFGYLANHGLPSPLINELFQASAQFHALPREAKLAIEINEFHRGFMPINTSTDTTTKLAKVTKPQQSESFMMMHELPDDDPQVLAGTFLAGPNQWPADLPDFKSTVRAYHAALSDLSRQLIRAVAVALNASPDSLLPHFACPTTFLRLLYYPPQPPQSPDDLYGSSPHTDYGFITLLLQDEVGGLQVRAPAGDWIDAPPIPGMMLMNVGDMLHRWSNGRLLSTPHRVINRSGQARYSCPFFFDPDLRSAIEPLPSCVSAENPAHFEPLVYGDFLYQQLHANHSQHAKRKMM